jgi:hypothetical protein
MPHKTQSYIVACQHSVDSVDLIIVAWLDQRGAQTVVSCRLRRAIWAHSGGLSGALP